MIIFGFRGFLLCLLFKRGAGVVLRVGGIESFGSCCPPGAGSRGKKEHGAVPCLRYVQGKPSWELKPLLRLTVVGEGSRRICLCALAAARQPWPKLGVACPAGAWCRTSRRHFGFGRGLGYGRFLGFDSLFFKPGCRTAHRAVGAVCHGARRHRRERFPGAALGQAASTPPVPAASRSPHLETGF